MLYAEDWRRWAVCTETDPEIFFPLGSMWRKGEADQAKAICWNCPVSAECLEWAMESGERYAIAGGMTPEERQALVRQVA